MLVLYGLFYVLLYSTQCSLIADGTKAYSMRYYLCTELHVHAVTGVYTVDSALPEHKHTAASSWDIKSKYSMFICSVSIHNYYICSWSLISFCSKCYTCIFIITWTSLTDIYCQWQHNASVSVASVELVTDTMLPEIYLLIQSRKTTLKQLICRVGDFCVSELWCMWLHCSDYHFSMQNSPCVFNWWSPFRFHSPEPQSLWLKPTPSKEWTYQYPSPRPIHCWNVYLFALGNQL